MSRWSTLIVLLAYVARAEDAGAGLPSAAPDAGAMNSSAVLPMIAVLDGGVGLELGGFVVRASGYAQVDGTPYSQASLDELNPATGQPLNEVGVTIRHLHLGLSASRWVFAGAAEVDGNTVAGLGVRLYSAEVSARWPLEGPAVGQLSAGLLRIPFGVDVQTEALRRSFLEPTVMSQALFPGSFDLGVEVSGEWRFLRYQLAMMNGEPVGERALPAKDPNAAKDFLGRVGVAGAPTERLRVEAGVSGLTGTGFHPGTPPTKDALVWRDANEDGMVQSTELQIIGGLPATPSVSFNRFALGADFQATVELPVLGALDVGGELIWGKNLDRGLFVADPVSTGRDQREVGWALWATQQLALGFAVGVRHDVYNPDADAADQQGLRRVPSDSSISTWSVVASWRWERTARVMAQYDHQTNALGRGVNGAPTTLGSDRLTLRAEVSF